MVKHDEMTRYAFISHMEDYMKKLLKDPMHADTDEFLKSHDIDGPKALSILLKKSNPEDENSSIIIRTEKIKDNGVDDNGKKKPESFTVKYKIPRKDYTKKMRNLYINLFESNIVDDGILKEDGEGGGATSADASGQFTTPLFGKPIKRKTMYITQEQADYIKKTIKEEAVMDTPIGNFGYDAPIGDGKKNKKNNFYTDANDHKDMMKNSWQGNLNESQGLKSQKLFDIFKRYGRAYGYVENGHRKKLCGGIDLHEVTDDDVIGVFPYNQLIDAKYNAKKWAQRHGFQMNPEDKIETIELQKRNGEGEYLYAVIIARNYNSPDYPFNKKLADRYKKNSGIDGSKQYKWKDNNDYWRLMAQNPWYKDWDVDAKKRLQKNINQTYRGGKQNDK